MSIAPGHNDTDYNELSDMEDTDMAYRNDDPPDEPVIDWLEQAKESLRVIDDLPAEHAPLAVQQAIACALIALVEKMPTPPRRSILDLKRKPDVWCARCERIRKDGEQWQTVYGQKLCLKCYGEWSAEHHAPSTPETVGF